VFQVVIGTPPTEQQRHDGERPGRVEGEVSPMTAGVPPVPTTTGSLHGGREGAAGKGERRRRDRQQGLCKLHGR